MSTEERTGTRFDPYSMWHRVKSLFRFLKNAKYYAMIDLDYVEYTKIKGVHYPLVYKELTSSMTDKKLKVIDVVKNTLLGHPLELPFLIVRYIPSEEDLQDEYKTVSSDIKDIQVKDIKRFIVTLYYFKRSDSPIYEDKEFTPQEYANLIENLRAKSTEKWRNRLNK